MVEKKDSPKLEREYVIPLREKCRVVPRYKKANKAIRSIKEFLAQHMQIRDRDLNKIKLDLAVNEAIWHRGIRKPLHKIKVKAIKEGDIVRVELVHFTKSAQAKKARLEKREEKAVTKKSPAVKPVETKKEKVDSKEEKAEDEKKESLEKVEQQIEKELAKEKKHTPKKEKSTTVKGNKRAK